MRSSISLGTLLSALLMASLALGQTPPSTGSAFPKGAATSSEECGVCHQAIYREFQFGIGADLHYSGMVLKSATEQKLNLPAGTSGGATAHAISGIDPFPIHARDAEEKGRSCDVCHYPQSFKIPSMDAPESVKPIARSKEQEAQGLTCASCHLTPEGSIRAPHQVNAPHPTVVEPEIQSAAMCAYCHSMGKRVIGKQTQTFLEWREDFNKPGLGRQQCQDCHMPRTVRKTAEGFDVPLRPVARHLWTGGHSLQRLGSALSLTLVQPQQNTNALEIHIVNIGAGHSVPTGSNRRGLFLRTEVLDERGKIITKNEWMFAPSFGNRPDDRRFLEEDKKREDAIAASQADAQGPHESSIRAGEERIIAWAPELKRGTYKVRAVLIYDLNRYNDPGFADDQTTLTRAALDMVVDLQR